MNIYFKLLAVTISAAVLLTGCSSTAEVSDPAPTAKEAGVLGTRICFTNSSGLPVSAAAGGRVVASEAGHITGEPGVVDAQAERCFAGRNSYEVYSTVTSFTEGQIQEWATEDVAVSTNVDGEYGILLFTGYNPSVKAPRLRWRNSADPLTPLGDSLEIGETKNIQEAGHKFAISRRGDSDLYKEFLVNFTK